MLSLIEKYNLYSQILKDLRNLWVTHPEYRTDELKENILFYYNIVKGLK